MKIIYKITSTIVLALSFFLLMAGSSAHAEGAKVSHLYIGDYEMVKYVGADGHGEVYRETVYASSSSGKVVKDRTNNGRDWTRHYYYTDHLGGTQFILKDDGNPEPFFESTGSTGNSGEGTNPILNNLGIGSGSGSLSRLKYFPYGDQITGHSVKDFPVEDTYTGQKSDEEVDLMYYNARLYNPSVGTFVQADKQIADGFNRYGYVKGNPISLNDPDGEFGNLVVGFAIGAGVDFGFQVASGMLQGKGFVESVQDVNWTSVVISGGAGALTSGASAIASIPARVAVAATIDFAANTAIEAVNNPNEPVGAVIKNASIQTAVNTVGFGVAGYVGGKAVGKISGAVSSALKSSSFSSSSYSYAADVMSVPVWKEAVESGVGTDGSVFKSVYNQFVRPFAMKGGKGKVDLRIHPEQLEIMRMYRDGDVKGALKYATQAAEKHGFSFNIEEGFGARTGWRGGTDYGKGSITVDAGLSEFEMVKVSAHELGHVLDERRGFQAKGFRWTIRGSEMRQQFFNAWAYWQEGDEALMKESFYNFYKASEGAY